MHYYQYIELRYYHHNQWTFQYGFNSDFKPSLNPNNSDTNQLTNYLQQSAENRTQPQQRIGTEETELQQHLSELTGKGWRIVQLIETAESQDHAQQTNRYRLYLLERTINNSAQS